MNQKSRPSSDVSRRRFFGQASCAAVSSIPVLNTILNLQLAERLAAVTAPANNEYRALVCLFLSGGNDSFNMLVPRDPAAYATYQGSRSNLALTPAQLIDINPVGLPNFAVHSGMPEVAVALSNWRTPPLWPMSGRLSSPCRTAPRSRRTSKLLPLGLYSHSDQIEQWQTGIPHSRSGIGWGGRMADLLQSLNTNPLVPMNISLDGSNVWQTGDTTAEYSITTGGAVGLANYKYAWQQYDTVSQALSQGVDGQLAQQYSNLLQQTFNTRKKQAMDAYNVFANATSGQPARTASRFPAPISAAGSPWSRRRSRGAPAVGATRQTFFVQRGGWDHHSGVLANQADDAARGQRGDRRLPQLHGRARHSGQGHALHGLRLRPHAHQQRAGFRPRLGQQSGRGRRLGDRQAHLRRSIPISRSTRTAGRRSIRSTPAAAASSPPPVATSSSPNSPSGWVSPPATFR